MNKRFSTLLAAVLVAGGVSAFAAPAASTALKDGDIVFIENGAEGANAAYLTPIYLKPTADLKGIEPVFQKNYKPDTKAKIDSISWKVEERINAEGKKDYAFVNVLNKNLTLSFAAASKVANTDPKKFFGTTDSATVISTKSYWADVNATNGKVLAYQFRSNDGDFVMAVGVSNYNKKFLMLRIAKAPLVGSLENVVETFENAEISSDYTSWSFNADGPKDALAVEKTITYADLKTPVIQSTNIPGLANFKVVPVKSYANGVIHFYDEKDKNADKATQFAFLPANQIGVDNPEYFSISTKRYELASTHKDEVFAYGLTTDTIVTKTNDKKDIKENGLKVFSMSYLVGNPDSVTFTPAAAVWFDRGATKAPYFTVEKNPKDSGETAVLGAAVLEDKVLVSTVFKDNRLEGTLKPYGFTAPVYPEIAEGYYFIKSANAATANKYAALSLCGTAANNYRDFVDAVSADNSYQVWVVSGTGKDLKIENRYTKEDYSLILFEAGEGLYTTGQLDTISFEKIEDIKKGGVDYYQIETPDYKKFALKLVNGIGQNIYVTTVADSTLGVKVDDASLLLYPTVKDSDKYGVNDELVAETYTFKTKDGKVLTRNAKGQLIIADKEDAWPVILAFKNAGNGEYYAVYNTNVAKGIADQAGAQTWYLNTQATDNYIQYVEAKGCPDGQDRFTLEAPAAPKYLTVAPGHYTIKTDGREDMLTMGTDSASIFRRITSDLKADYTKESFSLWIDTALYNAEGTENIPTYFILKGAASATDTLSGNFLGKYRTDSVMFVAAKRIATKDTLILDSGEALKNAAVLPFQFKFPFVSGEEGAVYVQNGNNDYLRIINEYVTLTKNKAEAIAVNVVSADAPTANDDVTVATVKVVAGAGQVTVAGAAGKKVVVTNILGQVVANTVLTSDNATIAAPQGVVVVAVEGEEAVKAIVK